MLQSSVPLGVDTTYESRWFHLLNAALKKYEIKYVVDQGMGRTRRLKHLLFQLDFQLKDLKEDHNLER